MKNEKRTVFRFPFFYENEKRMKVLKIQRKNLLNMKMVVSYLNFVFQFNKKNEMTLWVHGLLRHGSNF